MLKVIFGNQLVELDSNGVIGDGIGNQHGDAALLCDGLEAVVSAVDLLHDRPGEVVPAKLFDEQLAEVECLEPLPGTFAVNCHFPVFLQAPVSK